MDPKRKRLYLILSAACLILSVGILLWSHLSNSSQSLLQTPTVHISNQVPTKQIVPGQPPIFTQPAVFPANQELNNTLLDLSAFKSLQVYEPLIPVSGNFGKEDLFK